MKVISSAISNKIPPALKVLLADWVSMYRGNNRGEKRLTITLTAAWLTTVVFLSGIFLAERSLLMFIVPGQFISWPGIESSTEISLYLPVQNQNRIVNTPQNIYLDIDEERQYYFHLFDRIFSVLAGGRRLKKPGEDFYPSDDLILKLLPRITLHTVWKTDKALLVDLDSSSLPESKDSLREVFTCLYLTVTGNEELNSKIKGLSVEFYIDGISVKNKEHHDEKFSERLDYIAFKEMKGDAEKSEGEKNGDENSGAAAGEGQKKSDDAASADESKPASE